MSNNPSRPQHREAVFNLLLIIPNVAKQVTGLGSGLCSQVEMGGDLLVLEGFVPLLARSEAMGWLTSESCSLWY